MALICILILHNIKMFLVFHQRDSIWISLFGWLAAQIDQINQN